MGVQLKRWTREQYEALVRAGVLGEDDHVHPTTAALVAEVADTTLEFDRTRKGPIYAQAAIPEYWIVDLNAGVVEAYRQPHTGPDGRASYRVHLKVGRDGEISPLVAPGAPIPVRDLLP